MKHLKKLSVIQILVAGYLLVILAVAILLSLPISSATQKGQPFIDSLFVATSGISTTGLTPVDIGSYYSLFGQLVLLADIQIGGLGYMAFVILFAYLIHKKLSIRSHLIASESVSGATPAYNFKFFGMVALFTFVIELIGGIILGFQWLENFPPAKAFYFGFFHSINAFCTAGFGLMPDSFISYNKNVVINLTIILVSLVGGIGFYVLNEICTITVKSKKREMPVKLSTHTKLAVATTLALVVIGAVIFLVAEKWDAASPLQNRIMTSVFQAVTAQTTDGYNTVDISKISSTSLFMLIVLMFIGASPGSTGGGIKTTTFGTICLSLKAYIFGEKDVNFGYRKMAEDTIRKSFMIFFLFVGVCLIDMLVLTLVEKFDFHQILFETVSALGNVGLSTGITPSLSYISKIFIIITMFVGRVGALTVALALVGKKGHKRYSYPEEIVFVG